MAYQITESKQVSAGKDHVTVYIEDKPSLAEIPNSIKSRFALGSAAYTSALDIFIFTANGWVDDNGTVVSS